jgi:CheY-like chemotaxis protein
MDLDFTHLGRTPTAAAPQAPVVVLDQDEVTRQLLAKLLILHGYAVRTAADPRELAALLREVPKPRAILLDAELPGIGGARLLALLKKHPKTSEIPVFMMTANAAEVDAMQELDVEGCLCKPVSAAALRPLLQKVLRGQG